MSRQTIKVYGSKKVDDSIIQKQFRTLDKYEKWVGLGTGIVKGLSFYKGSMVIYKFGYRNGNRRNFNKPFEACDYDAWNNWYKNNG